MVLYGVPLKDEKDTRAVKTAVKMFDIDLFNKKIVKMGISLLR